MHRLQFESDGIMGNGEFYSSVTALPMAVERFFFQAEGHPSLAPRYDFDAGNAASRALACAVHFESAYFVARSL